MKALFGLVALLLVGCVAHNAADIHQKRMQERARRSAAEPKYAVKYDVSLTEVGRPAEAQSQFGDIKISQMDTSKGPVFRSQDGLLDIIWTGPGQELDFDLTNKADAALKVIWDDAAYVDVSGHSHRVIHNGVKLADRNSPQPPSVVPSKGRLNDMVYPSDHVSYSDVLRGWSQLPMFPCIPKYSCPESLQKPSTAHTGMDYRVLLPIQVGKDSYPYTFVFHVNRVELVPMQGREGGGD
jgi:hypothetical protein